jgi:hypothetical protein
MNRFWYWTVWVILLVSLTALQCSIEKPVTPTWNLRLTLPLVNKHYDMATLIDKMDQEYLTLDSLGNPLFYFQEEMDTVRLTDKLRCDPMTLNFRDTLGIISINPGESREMMVLLGDLYDGEPGDVPPCSATVRDDLEPFSDFSRVHVQQAFGSLEVGNNLGLDLNLIRIRLIDGDSGDTLYTVMLSGGLADGGSLSQSVVFEETTLSNRLSIEITGASLGGHLPSAQGKNLSVALTLDSMQISWGQARVPSLEISQSETLVLPTTNIIDSAGIRSGQLTLDLHNFTNLDANVSIDLHRLKKDGQSLSAERSLPAFGSSGLSLSLDGYSLTPSGGNSVVLETRVFSPGSSGSLVDFASSDSVTVGAQLSELVFTYVAGIIEPTHVAIGPMDRELNLPQGFESAQLVNASLSLEIHNGVDLPVDLSVDVQGDNGQDLILQADVPAAGPFGTAVTYVQRDDLGSLLSPVPQQVTINGEIICGDGQTFGIAREENFIFGVVKVSSPLDLIWDSCQIQIDPSSDEADEDLRELIRDQLNSGKVVLKVENHLPLAAEAEIYFSEDENRLFSNPDLVIGPVVVTAGRLDRNGLVEGPNFSTTEIEVTYTDLQVFANGPFYMGGVVDLPGTGGQLIRASAADYLSITSYMELEVKNKKD